MRRDFYKIFKVQLVSLMSHIHGFEAVLMSSLIASPIASVPLTESFALVHVAGLGVFVPCIVLILVYKSVASSCRVAELMLP